MTEKVKLVTLECGSANAIDDRLLQELRRGLDEALASGDKAVVVTGYDGFFSAGLNLKTLPGDEAGMARFIDHFEEVNLELLRFPLPVVAAVNGHAIAGGCVLACACDVRIGSDEGYKIGVSEVSLGIVFPASAFEIMRHTLSAPAIPDVLLGGKLLSPQQAHRAGILHEVVPKEKLLEVAFEKAAELGGKPPLAFRHSKLALRAPILERIGATRDESRRGFLETWFSDDVVQRRRAMLEKS
jgi:enoyl-CoA hydratase